jgi:hypothetical protein
MELLLGGGGGFIALILVLAFIAPSRVAYAGGIVVNAPISDVYDDIRPQKHLMRWSAWPQETRPTCGVEGPGGVVGTKAAFFTKGKRVGQQEVVALKENKEVALNLVGLPPQGHTPFEHANGSARVAA